MTDSDNVMALLAEANPIPEIAALERSVQFHSGDIIDVAPTRSTGDSPSGVRFALISLVVAALLSVTLFFVARSTTVDPVETIPAPTLPETPAPTTEPATTNPPPIPASLDGAWNAASFSLVFSDGRYAVETVDLAVDAGSYLYDDDELVLVSDDSSASCPAGAEARFVVGLSAEVLDLEPVDDECGLDRGLGVGSKSLELGEASSLPPSALNVARPLNQLVGPGLYVADRFSPEFSVVLQRGWRFHAVALPADVDFTTSINDANTLIVWHRHDVDSPEGVYELFSAHPVVEAGEPRPTTIAGAEGITFDYLSPGPNNLLNAPGIGAGSIVGPPENVWRTWALDVDGVVVTVVASLSPDTIEEKSIEVDRILNSIIWSE